MTLRSNIHVLCRDHLTTTPFGTVMAVALLTQLEQAIKPQPSGTGAAKGGGSVLNLTALALWEEIAADIGIHTRESGLTPNPDRREALIQWEAMEDDSAWGDFMEHATLDWIERIEALLSPIKPYHPSHPCPACGVEFHGEDRTPPLNVHHIGPDGKQLNPEAWIMECVACDAQWSGKNLDMIAQAMSA